MAHSTESEPLAQETAAWLRIGHAPPEYLTVDEAAGYLRMSSRQLIDRADILRVDVAPSGATRPQWRYRLSYLQARFGLPMSMNHGK